MKPLCAALLLLVPHAIAQQNPGNPQPTVVDIVRDPNGVPHVFAATNEGACFGAGYIAACDRLFQMELFRRCMRGTLAEILPNGTYEGALVSDKRARSLGFAHYADDLMLDPMFDSTTKAMLDAYAAGVNVRLNDLRQLPATSWPPMFVELQISTMADWTAADCVLVWMYIQDLFGAFSDGDLHAMPPPDYSLLDTGGAVLPDLGNGLLAQLLKRAKRPDRGEPAEPLPILKASDNLVIHGSRTASGKPIMLAKPQHPVSAPSFYYEYAMTASGGDLDCRGAGLAGCPAFLHGWNRFAAWSLTAMGADMSDVYKVKFENSGHTQYLLGTTLLNTTEFAEPIQVRGGCTVPWKHRRTIWGPIVTPLDCGQDPHCCAPVLPAGDREYAMRSLILDDMVVRHKQSIRGAMLMMRAGNQIAFNAGVNEWRSPSVHLLIATTEGNIGYRSMTGLPKRAAGWTMLGQDILDGNTTAFDWVGEVLPSELPKFLGNPLGQYTKSYLSTANNLACDPALLPQPFVMGLFGDTERAWRLREILDARLAQPTNVTVSDVLAMDHDTVNPIVRTFVILARVMQSAGVHFSTNGQRVLTNIVAWGQPWQYDAGLTDRQYKTLNALHEALGTFSYDAVNTSWSILVQTFGSRNYGIIRMLRSLSGDEANYLTHFQHHAELEAWVHDELEEAYQDFLTPPHPVIAPAHCTVAHQDNYLKLHAPSEASNFPAHDVPLDDLQCSSTTTIWAQGGETYKFLADFTTPTYPDGNYALLPPGVSEDWNSTLYFNHDVGWKSGTMYPAKLTRGQFTETPVRTFLYP